MTTPNWDNIPTVSFAQDAAPSVEGEDFFTPETVSHALPPIALAALKWHALGLNIEAVARRMDIAVEDVLAVSEEYYAEWEFATEDAYFRCIGLMFDFATGDGRANSGQLSYLHDMLGYLGSLVGATDGDESTIQFTQEDSDDDS